MDRTIQQVIDQDVVVNLYSSSGHKYICVREKTYYIVEVSIVGFDLLDEVAMRDCKNYIKTLIKYSDFNSKEREIWLDLQDICEKYPDAIIKIKR